MRPRYLPQFDSASTMMRAVAHFLHGRDFPRLRSERLSGPTTRLVSSLPRRAAETIYRWGGWTEARSASQLSEVDQEEISRWVAGSFPRRRYPAVAVGSANGAAVHLCAALGIPWFPQTVLVQLRRTIDVDDLVADLEIGARAAPAILEANPDLQLHHMADPNQDRLMLRRLAYFRLKRLRLGGAEHRFVREHLEPGGTIFVVDCQKRWPATQVGERHWFQAGGSGGATRAEYLHGSARVAEFLGRRGAGRTRFAVPEPDAEVPESEWGFEPALADDVAHLADDLDARVVRLSFDEPDDLSPLVANLHRWWYRRLRRRTDRLLVPSFFLVEPYWTLRTSSVPYWASFSVEPAARSVDDYLDEYGPFSEIHAMVFNHGIESIGVAGVDRWQRVLDRATERSGFVGLRPRHFPRDFNTFVRYHDGVKALGDHQPLPTPLGVGELDAFLDRHAGDHPRVTVDETRGARRGLRPAAAPGWKRAR